MAIKQMIVYSRQGGSPDVPITVRVTWLPSGIIKPQMYWTPDDSCFKITHIYECTQQAFLKSKGMGVRFKIKAEIIKTSQVYPDYPIVHDEIYLYLADNRFCEKNIVDERYAHAGKEYIPVVLDIFPDGGYQLVYFWVQGIRYLVEKTNEVAPQGSYNAGGVGIRHNVEARKVNENDDEDADPNNSLRRIASIYLELNKWFVSVCKPGADIGDAQTPLSGTVIP